jgi:hypothetical protein
MTVTTMQQTAIGIPCVEAEDTTDPRYKHYALPWSIILTCNVGFE